MTYTKDNHPFKIGQAWGWSNMLQVWVITSVIDGRFTLESANNPTIQTTDSLNNFLHALNEGGNNQWMHQPKFDRLDLLEPEPTKVIYGDRLSFIEE